MNVRLASLLLIASATILSLLSILLGQIVIPLFRNALQPRSMAELRAFMPAPTLFVCDHLPLVAVLLAVVCGVSLAFLWRLPATASRCVVAGLCAQWFVVWLTGFCLCYAGFLSDVSMHHSQHFEIDEFLSLAGGAFPVSLVCIVVPLAVALWPSRNPMLSR